MLLIWSLYSSKYICMECVPQPLLFLQHDRASAAQSSSSEDGSSLIPCVQAWSSLVWSYMCQPDLCSSGSMNTARNLNISSCSQQKEIWQFITWKSRKKVIKMAKELRKNRVNKWKTYLKPQENLSCFPWNKKGNRIDSFESLFQICNSFSFTERNILQCLNHIFHAYLCM